MLIGIILGLTLKDKAQILEPLGNLFINLLCSIIVPILFTSLVLAIAKMKPKTTQKLLKAILLVFIIYSIASLLWGIFVTKSINLVSHNIKIDANVEINNNSNIFKQIIDMFSVDDFAKLLSRDNIIAIMLISFLTGFAIRENNDSLMIKIIESIDNIVKTLLKYIMYYAPIGICAYMAYNVGMLGFDMVESYLKVFVTYFIASLLFAGLFYSIIAKISGCKIRNFWKYSIPVITTSLSTCSSAATMPINIDCANKLNDNIPANQATISLGTSFHKDGSVIDSVFKIMFLVTLFNSNTSLIQIMLTAIIATLLISAVPIGGGTISEMLILSLLGFPTNALPILTIIATITDAPATMLNALGDTSATLLVNKFIKKDATT